MKPVTPHGPRVGYTRIAIIAMLAPTLFTGCKPSNGGGARSAPPVPTAGQLAALPLGDIAGIATLGAGSEIANPLEGNPDAIADGRRLFISMNCAGCHGYGATGNMGPDLTDAYWRYGGTPAGVYNSIYGGRPQGMPAWGRALPPQNIWKIVAYLQSLGGMIAANQYHSGLQGDHDSTSTAAEAQGLAPHEP
jgi:cytochrome c oxidase cbb3-type subunit 3